MLRIVDEKKEEKNKKKKQCIYDKISSFYLVWL